MREGSSIGPYRVVRKIGEGGMGAVYLGEHTLIGRRAAIKILLPELSSRRDSVDRFFNEARATTAISDPGIVQVFDFGFTPDKVAYIVMELLEGEQLNVRLARLRALTPADALRITRQAAGSLGAAHAAGIVHRDLKPENLFMIRDPEALGGERPKILDFGIAKLGDELPDRVKTRTGAVLGTPVYMSPEQCHGASRVDHRADIYALGCVLCQLITGRPPFDLSGVGAIISAHLREPPPRPSSRIPQLPPAIDELVLRCLAKTPDERFATMLELQQACDAILGRIARGSAQTFVASGSAPMPMAFPTPVLTPSTPPEAGRTTLSTSSGQSLGGVPRRRLGMWIAAAALAGGAGATVAVLISRPAAPGIRGSAAQAATPPAPAAGEGGDAAAVAPPPPPPPTASATPRPPAAPAAQPGAPTAVPPAPAPGAPNDAGAAAAAAMPAPASHAEPVRPPAAAATRKPGPTHSPAPSKPKRRPDNEELYDDPN